MSRPFKHTTAQRGALNRALCAHARLENGQREWLWSIYEQPRAQRAQLHLVSRTQRAQPLKLHVSIIHHWGLPFYDEYKALVDHWPTRAAYMVHLNSIYFLSSQQDCISLALRAPWRDATCVSEAFCPNIQPRAHARLTGLTIYF